MKIERLDLRAFGPFTNKVLDLSGGAEGLHLVYGDNEKGKTSALRALGDLFFGIPVKSPDDFVHRYDKLRVAAAIVRRDGRRLEFCRRKGNKATLLAGDEKTPLDDGALRDFIGGCDRQQFQQMFGIDHRLLVEGGQAIARGHGEVGQVLFAAGAGIADLRSVAAALAKDADDLFKPSGSNPAINRLIAQLKETTKKIRECQLPGSHWHDHQQALASATAELATADGRFQLATQRRNRLKRIGDAVPVAAHWRQLGQQLADHATTPRLSPNFAESRRETVSSLEAARKTLLGIEEEVARIEAEIAAHVLPESLLAVARRIEQQHEKLGAHRKAERDRPLRQAEAQEKKAVAQQILHGLRPELPLSEASSLYLNTNQQVEIQKLARRGEVLQQEARQATEGIAASQRRSAELAEALNDLPAACDSAPLAETIAAIQSEGNLEQQAGKLRADVARLKKQIAADCQRLGLATGDLATFERLPLPPAETVDRFERTCDDSDKALARATEAWQQAESERTALVRQLDGLRSAGELPTESDLAAVREARDRLWERVLAAWKRLAPEDGLADAYRQSVLAVDAIADRLRGEAQRVAEFTHVTAELAAAEKRAEAALQQLQAARIERAAAESQWHDCWRPAEIRPLPPREMRAWLQRHQALLARGQACDDLQSELAQCEARIAAHTEIIARQLAMVDRGLAAPSGVAAPVDAALPTLTEMLARAAATVKRLDEHSRLRQQLTAESKQLARTLLTAGQKAEQNQRAREEWRRQWEAAIAPLGLGPETDSERVTEFVLQCNEMTAHLNEAEQLQARIDAIDADGRQFRAEVVELLAAIEPAATVDPLQEKAHEKAVEELFARLQRAIADRRNTERWQDDRRRQLERRDATRSEVVKLQARLDEHCREAGCAAAAELPAVEQRAAAAAELLVRWEACEAELLRLARGESIAALVAEVEATVVDDIDPQLDRIEREIADLEAARAELHQRIGGEKKALASMDTSAAAALAAEDEQEILAHLESDVARYLRLRLASVILDEGIERYRKKNEGPVLSRASVLFARLTSGSFEGLKIDLDRQQIVGVRGADTIPTEAMSEGSCDQLYLALRLASLETYLERNEPWPLIVDDILISFDDRRAAAAFEVLAELSRKTQVVFFAHHRHLLEIARASVPEQTLFVHEL